MRRPTIKRHEVATVRRNTGEEYRGCLTVSVPRSRELYWWIEGAMTALGRSVDAMPGRPPFRSGEATG
jgi:hypothetical protein